MSDEARIEIEKDGPFVVYGEVPLLEMAPVHTFNGEPVAWHVLGDVPTSEEPVYLCRCGQSSQKPFCDDSHLTNGFDGTETADRNAFTDRAGVDSSGNASIADDGILCVSAGFCGTRTTDVWKLLPEAGDEATYARMRDMIWACPSGRLVLRDRNGDDVEPELPSDIAVVPGGPLWVRGGISIQDSDGQPWERRNRVTLCRCGESANKPFCDGSHEEAHFDER